MTNHIPGRHCAVATFLFACLLAAPTIGRPADAVASAEAALARFHATCDKEIRLAVPPETMIRINELRNAPSLVIARKSYRDFAEFKDPQSLAEASRYDLFGSRGAVRTSTGDIWVLTYDAMKGLTAYLDAASGAVLYITFIPEG